MAYQRYNKSIPNRQIFDSNEQFNQKKACLYKNNSKQQAEQSQMSLKQKLFKSNVDNTQIYSSGKPQQIYKYCSSYQSYSKFQNSNPAFKQNQTQSSQSSLSFFGSSYQSIKSKKSQNKLHNKREMDFTDRSQILSGFKKQQQQQQKIKQKKSHFKRQIDTLSMIKSSTSANSQDHDTEYLQTILEMSNDEDKIQPIRYTIKNQTSSSLKKKFNFKKFNEHYRQIIDFQDYLQKQLKKRLRKYNQLDIYEELKVRVLNQKKLKQQMHDVRVDQKSKIQCAQNNNIHADKVASESSNHPTSKYILHFPIKQQNIPFKPIFDQIIKYQWANVIVLKIYSMKFHSQWKQLIQCKQFPSLKILEFENHSILNVKCQQLQQLKKHTSLQYIEFSQSDNLTAASKLQILKYCHNVNKQITIILIYHNFLVLNYQQLINLQLIFRSSNISMLYQLRNVQHLYFTSCKITNQGFNTILENLNIFYNLKFLKLECNNITNFNQQHLKTIYNYKLNAIQKQILSNSTSKEKQFHIYNQKQQNRQNHQNQFAKLIVDLSYNQLQKQSYIIAQKYSFFCLRTVLEIKYSYHEQSSQLQQQIKKLKTDYNNFTSINEILMRIYSLIIGEKPIEQLKSIVINLIPKSVQYTISLQTKLNNQLSIIDNKNPNNKSSYLQQLKQNIINESINKFAFLHKISNSKINNQIQKIPKNKQLIIYNKIQQFQNLFIQVLKLQLKLIKDK